ncbi:uncharacterized protein [Euphorbia lathyris]|uniref:uncharacterized protein isoform X2 n=1 Tax=Euphorbia lathyris TaxID=212925 RepID=UPI003313218A
MDLICNAYSNSSDEESDLQPNPILSPESGNGYRAGVHTHSERSKTNTTLFLRSETPVPGGYVFKRERDLLSRVSPSSDQFTEMTEVFNGDGFDSQSGFRLKNDQSVTPQASHLMLPVATPMNDNEQPEKFTSVNFKIWQQKKYLTATTSNNSLRPLLENEKLSGTNFMDWSRNLQIVFRYESKEYVLNAALPAARPFGLGVTAEMVAQYDQHVKDDIDVSCIMLGTMVPDLQIQFMDQHAYEIMDQLKRMFQDQARRERYLTIKALCSTDMQPGTSVSTHVLKLKGYIDTLSRLGSPLPAELAVDIILGSLHESFNQFIVHYHMQGLDKSVVELHSMLKLAEQSFKRIPKVLLVNKGNVPIGKSKSKAKAQKAKSMARKAASPKARLALPDDICHECKEKGHWKNTCSKLREKQKGKDAASGTKK